MISMFMKVTSLFYSYHMNIYVHNNRIQRRHIHKLYMGSFFTTFTNFRTFIYKKVDHINKYHLLTKNNNNFLCCLSEFSKVCTPKMNTYISHNIIIKQLNLNLFLKLCPKFM